MQASAPAARSARLAVVGDVHGAWCSARDGAALRALQPDITLLVGDFGNEDVELVEQIAGLPLPKAVILGNHDAWYSMTAKRSRSPPAGSAQQAEAGGGGGELYARVFAQLRALGDAHVGYGHMPLPGAGVSIVGARPFSKGGKSLRTMRDFMSRLYAVVDMEGSAEKILGVVADRVPDASTPLVVMGHNGPAGLGSTRSSICGVDWTQEQGDHGDPDLQMALEQLKASGRDVALAVFGHMHHTLRGGGRRRMVEVDEESGTVFLNAATVPRVVPVRQPGDPGAAASRRHFLLVELDDGQVAAAADVWVQVSHASSDGAASPAAQAAPSASLVQLLGLQAQLPQAWALQPGREACHDGEWRAQVVDVQPVLAACAGSSGGGRRLLLWDASGSSWRQVDLPASGSSSRAAGEADVTAVAAAGGMA